MPNVRISIHGETRFFERGIDFHEAIQIAKNGRVTKRGNDGTMLKVGKCDNGRELTVVLQQSGNGILIKTAYYAN